MTVLTGTRLPVAYKEVQTSYMKRHGKVTKIMGSDPNLDGLKNEGKPKRLRYDEVTEAAEYSSGEKSVESGIYS